MSTALSTLREYLATSFCRHDEFKSLVPDAAGGTTTNIRCAALKAVYDDNNFRYWWGRFTGSTNAGTNFRVTAFANTNGDLTISPAVSDGPVAADTFQLMKQVHPDELDTAINWGILSTENIALEPKKDETLVTVANTYEYTIPSGFEYISEVIEEGGTENEFHKYYIVDYRGWDIVSDGTTPKLVINPQYYTQTVGRNLRLIGQSKPSVLATESATTEIFAPYIVCKALEYLYRSRIKDDESYKDSYIMCKSDAMEMIPDVQVSPQGRRVHW